MINNQSPKRGFDLEERTSVFSKKVISLCKRLPKTLANMDMARQGLRSATSVGANYREANEAISKKDFIFRLRICRKEAKETHYWLDLLSFNNPYLKEEISLLEQEAMELVKIFPSIIEKNI